MFDLNVDEAAAVCEMQECCKFTRGSHMHVFDRLYSA